MTYVIKNWAIGNTLNTAIGSPALLSVTNLHDAILESGMTMETSVAGYAGVYVGSDATATTGQTKLPSDLSGGNGGVYGWNIYKHPSGKFYIKVILENYYSTLGLNGSSQKDFGILFKVQISTTTNFANSASTRPIPLYGANTAGYASWSGTLNPDQAIKLYVFCDSKTFWMSSSGELNAGMTSASTATYQYQSQYFLSKISTYVNILDNGDVITLKPPKFFLSSYNSASFLNFSIMINGLLRYRKITLSKVTETGDVELSGSPIHNIINASETADIVNTVVMRGKVSIKNAFLYPNYAVAVMSTVSPDTIVTLNIDGKGDRKFKPCPSFGTLTDWENSPTTNLLTCLLLPIE